MADMPELKDIAPPAGAISIIAAVWYGITRVWLKKTPDGNEVLKSGERRYADLTAYLMAQVIELKQENAALIIKLDAADVKLDAAYAELAEVRMRLTILERGK